jgi:hypothetical protein
LRAGKKFDYLAELILKQGSHEMIEIKIVRPDSEYLEVPKFGIPFPLHLVTALCRKEH